MHKGGSKHVKEMPAIVQSNQEYLNFVKKNHKAIDHERNKLMYPSAIEISRNNSVFAIKDKKYYKTEKLTGSINTPSYPLQSKRSANEGEVMSSQKIYEIIEKKNHEIQESMNKEKQSMSEIVYNFSKFRSMEHNYYRNDKIKRKPDKIYKDKIEDPLKFPQLGKNFQEIFTIDYDSQGKKIVKVNIKHLDFSPEKKKPSSLFAESTHSRDLKEAKPPTSERQLFKNDLNIFKRKKPQNQFGIQIKSINNRILQSNLEYEHGLKLRKEIYEIVPSMEVKKKEKFYELKKENDEHLEKEFENRQAATEEEEYQTNTENDQIGMQTFRKKQLNELQNYHYNIINTKDVFANQPFLPYKPKFSALSCYSTEKNEYQRQGDAKDDLLLSKDKQSESLPKRQGPKKNQMIVSHQKQFTIYDQKINSYRQLLFMMNLAHRKFDPLVLRDFSTYRNEQKYKYYIGNGNNSLLVKSLLKRRFWWVQEDDYKKANFVWTQLKINNYYQFQKKAEYKDLDGKLDADFVSAEKKKKPGKMGIDSKPSQKGSYKPPLPGDKDKIFTIADKRHYEGYQSNICSTDMAQRMQKYSNRLRYFQTNLLTNCKQDKSEERLHNHLEFNFFIGNKKALFYNLKQYYQLLKKNVFQIIPLTYHIKTGVIDPEYIKFCKEFKKLQILKNKKKDKNSDESKKLKNIWIVKPGQLSNRGNGIFVIDEIYELNNVLKKKEKHADGNDKTYIVQKYIEKPLLYKGRKFDIRHYMIISRLHGLMRAYWYGQGYIRTSSFDFDLDDVGDQMIHLTNDAIQKNSTFYGKHEEGNKLSYSEFQKYLDQKFGEGKCSFADQIYPQMKSIATDAVKSTYLQLDPNNMEHNFQVFGLDYMIDENLGVWLIEVNTNPCLELSSKLLGRIIPTMLEHAFRLTVDVIYPPPTHYPNSQKYLAPDNPLGRMMFQLIFDEARDSKELIELYKHSKSIDYGGQVKQDDETYENEGRQIELSPDLG